MDLAEFIRPVELTLLLFKVSHEIEREETLPNLSYEYSFPNWTKIQKKKKKERPVSKINIYTKILNKILSNQT
jgi:hypothetical protein